MKKVLALAVTACLMICMAGCNSNNNSASESRNTTTTETETYDITAEEATPNDSVSTEPAVNESTATETETETDAAKNNEAETVNNTEKSQSSKLSKDAIKAEDIDWKVEETIVDGDHRVVFSYVNNSPYTIKELRIEFTQREDLTDEEKSALNNYVSENDLSDVFDESEIADMYGRVWLTQIVAPGETSEEVGVNVSGTGYYFTNYSQFEVFEPGTMSIEFITDNDTLYTTYYDFRDGVYGDSSEGETPAHEWGEGAAAEITPIPNAPVVTVSGDFGDSLYYEAIGMSSSDFSAYIDECKTAGFNIDPYELEDFYSADTESDYSIVIDYDNTEGSVTGMVTYHGDDNNE